MIMDIALGGDLRFHMNHVEMDNRKAYKKKKTSFQARIRIGKSEKKINVFLMVGSSYAIEGRCGFVDR